MAKQQMGSSIYHIQQNKDSSIFDDFDPSLGHSPLLNTSEKDVSE